MSDRFFEIGREATLWCCDNLTTDDPDWEHKWEVKYGELIVQECARVVDEEDSSYPYNSFGHKLTQHFGVEGD